MTVNIFAGETESFLAAGLTRLVNINDSKGLQDSLYGITGKGTAYFNAFSLGVYMSVINYFATGATMLTVGPIYDIQFFEKLRLFAGLGVNMSRPDQFYLSEHSIGFPKELGFGIGAALSLYIQLTSFLFAELGATGECTFSGYTGANIHPFIGFGWRKIVEWS